MPVIEKLNTEDDLNNIIRILKANLVGNKKERHMPVMLSVIIGPREQMQKLYESLGKNESSNDSCIAHLGKELRDCRAREIVYLQFAEAYKEMERKLKVKDELLEFLAWKCENANCEGLSCGGCKYEKMCDDFWTARKWNGMKSGHLKQNSKCVTCPVGEENICQKDDDGNCKPKPREEITLGDRIEEFAERLGRLRKQGLCTIEPGKRQKCNFNGGCANCPRHNKIYDKAKRDVKPNSQLRLERVVTLQMGDKIKADLDAPRNTVESVLVDSVEVYKGVKSSVNNGCIFYYHEDYDTSGRSLNAFFVKDGEKLILKLKPNAQLVSNDR